MHPLIKKLLLIVNYGLIALFLALAASVVAGKITFSIANSSPVHDSLLHENAKRRCALIYFRTEGKDKEEAALVWAPARPDQNLQALLNAWFDGAVRDGIVSQKIVAESVAYDESSGDGIVSLSSSFCAKEASTREKLNLVESLLETMRLTGIPVRRVMFLVRQQQIHDRDLDFSCFWPIEGFIEKQ